jgi:drug/metabolite transporter (DMT)-like permease
MKQEIGEQPGIVPGNPRPHESHLTAYVALGSVCFFWGTTYLGIRMSLESFSPLTLIALRYTLSGGILLAAAWFSRTSIPRGREFWETALFGLISIGIGNGALSFAEEWVPSGLASLFITTSPFWALALDWMLPQGTRPSSGTMRGLVVGLVGVVLLIAPAAIKEGWHGRTLAGFLLLQFGSAGWLFGALLQRRQKSAAHPIVSGAVQQLATGLFFVLPALLFERWPAHVKQRPTLAVLYLVLFGSCVGYSSFVYSMAKLPVAIVSIYTYINPIVAVLLGWLFYREAFTPTHLAAMLIIFMGVWMVKHGSGRKVPVLLKTTAER